MPDTSSPVSKFMRMAYSMPRLTEEQETELAIKKNSGCVESARKLIEHNLWVVCAQSTKMKAYGLPQEDMIQEGSIGLMKAVKKFEPNKGARLSTFATVMIRSEMFNYAFSNYSITKITDSKENRKAFFNARRLAGDGLTIPQIAEELNVQEDTVSNILRSFNRLEDLYDEEGDLIFDTPDHSDHTRLIDEAAEMELLSRKLGSLPDRTREVLESRFLRDEPVKLEVLAEKYGVSKQRIDQIEKAGVKKLKELCHEV